MWSHWICDTISGARLLEVKPRSSRWRTSISGVGSGRHSFTLRDRATVISGSVWRDIATPWARTVVVCWDDVPQYAGLIRGNSYDQGSGVLTLETVELRAVFEMRMPFGVPDYDPNGVRSVTGKSLRGIARQVIRWGTFNTSPFDDWYLPVILPGDESGSESRSWQMYNFETVEQMLRQVQDTKNGPDIHLQPRWGTGGALEWAARIGTPRLTGTTFEWDTTAERSGLSGLTVGADASKQLTGVFALGAGSEADMKVGQSPFEGVPGTHIPNLDKTRSFKTIPEKGQLDKRALAELEAFREPSQMVEFGVGASGVLPALLPGSVLRAWVEDDEWIPDGWISGYTVGISGDLTDALKVEVV